VDVLPPVGTGHWRAETIDAHVASVRQMFLATLGQEQEVPPPAEEQPRVEQKESAAVAAPGIASVESVAPDQRPKKTPGAAVLKKTSGSKAAEKKAPAKKAAKKKALKKKARIRKKPRAQAAPEKKAGKRKPPRKKPLRKKVLSKKPLGNEPGA